MKPKDYLFIILLIFVLYIFSASHRIEIQTTQENIYLKLDSIHQSIEHRTHIDSLYWNHIEQCAFKLRDGIKYDTKN